MIWREISSQNSAEASTPEWKEKFANFSLKGIKEKVVPAPDFFSASKGVTINKESSLKALESETKQILQSKRKETIPPYIQDVGRFAGTGANDCDQR